MILNLSSYVFLCDILKTIFYSFLSIFLTKPSSTSEDVKNILKQEEILLLSSPVRNLLRHTVKDYVKAVKREELYSLFKIPTALDWGT